MASILQKKAKQAGLPLAELQPHAAVNHRLQIIFKTTGAPVQCPGFAVPPGASVTLVGVNGVANNAQMAFAADTAELLSTGTAHMIAPGDQDDYPCDNTAQIWLSGTAGDGILVWIRGGQVS